MTTWYEVQWHSLETEPIKRIEVAREDAEWVVTKSGRHVEKGARVGTTSSAYSSFEAALDAAASVLRSRIEQAQRELTACQKALNELPTSAMQLEIA